MSVKLSQIGVFGLINIIQKRAYTKKDVIVGIGDDTAVVKFNSKDLVLFTTDMLSEGVHFTKRSKPQDIGYKALACNISDVAAMGGLPDSAVVSLGMLPGMNAGYAKGILRGINKLAKKFKVSIVGGDTIRSDRIVINVALLGIVKKKNLVLRSGAKDGDIIFTTGSLGGSLRTGKHLRFIPRIKESQYLVEKYKPSSMIDISDGLAADLGHIVKQSSVGAFLYRDQIPVVSKASLRNALYDGEDFELLFTLSPLKAGKVMKSSSKYTFFPIGQIVKKYKGIGLVNPDGKITKLKKTGFDHFK